ncbi:MAG TPA: hypothetical protein VNZ50_05175 [Hyphomicrobiaceae bacterium]|nr:hypothetical protein [Hyphomicrobiaceae bacterium]
MTWSIDIAPMVPAPVLAAAVLVALALIGVLFFRRTRGAALRALALAALVAALANPSFRQEEREGLNNIAVVLVDESTSQSIAGRPAQTAAIRADLDEKLKRLPGLEVKWIEASRPTGERTSGTHLFTDLNRALSEVAPDRLAGVIMITDGQVHDIPASVAALGFNAPVHALITGRPDEFDRRIEVITAPKFGIVNGPPRDIEIAVRETGKSGQASRQVNLRVRREGQPDETVRTEIDARTRVAMPFPTAGQNIVEIELDPVPGELTHLNNRVVIAAEGVRENLRVLLVSGEPHAGERVWRNLLKSDAAVDLVHFTILRPPEKQDGTPIQQLSLIAFPTRELFSEKITNFDLIIFDRYQNRGILPPIYYDNIARYVANGGALLVASGDDYAQAASLYRTALAPVLPAAPSGRVIEQPFKAHITADGHKHPVTRSLPGLGEGNQEPDWGRWFRQVETNVMRGRTLMSGVEDRPLLVLDRVGRGRVALLLSDHAWLWARGYDGGGPHTDLLRRTAHWLMKEPDLEEERLLAQARGLKLTIERRSMETSVPPVAVQSPGGESSEVQLEPSGDGVWRTTIDVRQPGLYKMQTNGPAPERRVLTAVAHAGLEDAREMSEVTATDAKLRPLINATGGGTFWTRSTGLLSSASDTAVEVPRVSLLANARVLAGSGWMGLKDREAYVTRGVRITPMFTGLLALAALLAFLTLAWWREGR